MWGDLLFDQCDRELYKVLSLPRMIDLTRFWRGVSDDILTTFFVVLENAVRGLAPSLVLCGSLIILPANVNIQRPAGRVNVIRNGIVQQEY